MNQNVNIKVSSGNSKFSDAEVSCLPELGSSHSRRLAFHTSPLVLDFFAGLVELKHKTDKFWLGLDKRAGRDELWQNR